MKSLLDIDPAVFRAAMSSFASGVTIVTSYDRVEENPVGFTASAFSSLSLDPPLVLVCLDRKAESHRVLQQARTMAISILAEGQSEIAMRFASRGSDKFAGGTARAALTGCHVVDGAVAKLECEIEHLLPGGDHSIVVGRVVAAEVSPAKPMLYFSRQFGGFCAE